MTDQLTARDSDRGLVRIARNRDGRTWQVTARVGDSPDELRQAYEIARELELRLAADDPPPRARATTSGSG